MVCRTQEIPSMSYNIFPKTLVHTLLSGLLLAGGCMKQGPPLNYYTLSSPVQASSVSEARELPTILVGPVRLASFLNQGHLVSQRTDNSVALLEEHRWAGNLSEMLNNSMISELSHDLGSEKIYSFPNTNSESGLRLELDFLHFEQAPDKMATINARWRIVSIIDQSILATATSHYRVEPKTNDYDGLAQALSQGLSRLSQEISSRILLLTSTRGNRTS